MKIMETQKDFVPVKYKNYETKYNSYANKKFVKK
jgi:hypothetical protein